MAKQIGRSRDIAIGIEGTRGTLSTALRYFPRTSNSFYEKVEKVTDMNAVGSIVAERDMNIVNKYAGGDLESNTGVNTLGILLLLAFGQQSESEDTGVYTHNYSILESNQHPTISVVEDDGNGKFQYTNGALETLVINSNLGEYVNSTASIQSKPGAVSTATMPDEDTTDKPFYAGKVCIGIGTDEASAKANLLEAKSFSLTFNKNIFKDDTVCQLEPVDFLNQNLKIEGSFNTLINDLDEKDTALSEDEVYIVIKMALDANDESENYLEIDIPRADLSERTPNYVMDEPINQDISFTSMGAGVTATLINSVTYE